MVPAPDWDVDVILDRPLEPLVQHPGVPALHSREPLRLGRRMLLA
jgi:hypothetical protein